MQFSISPIQPTIDIMLPNAEPSPEWSDRIPAGYYRALPLFLQFLLSQRILPPRSTKIAQTFGIPGTPKQQWLQTNGLVEKTKYQQVCAMRQVEPLTC